MEDFIVIEEDGEVAVKPEIKVGPFTKFAMPFVRRNYSDIAKKIFTVEPMPQGALPFYYPEDIKEDK
jgi:hypothetical protein